MLFKTKMPVVRFVPEVATELSASEIREGVESGLFKDAPEPKVYGFVDVVENFSEKRTNLVLDINGDACLALRVRSRNVPFSAVRTELNSYLVRIREERGPRAVISKEARKELKEKILSEFLEKAAPVDKVLPIVLSLEDGVAYAFASGKADLNEIQTRLTQITGINYVRQTIDEEDFLTFVWWDTETNTLRQTLYKTFVGNKVTVSDESGVTITAKGSVEEARIAVSGGANATKAEIKFFANNVLVDAVLTKRGEFASLTFPRDVFEATGDPVSDAQSQALMVLDHVVRAFSMVDMWKDIYDKAVADNAGLTAHIAEVWGRGTFCSKQFDEI